MDIPVFISPQTVSVLHHVCPTSGRPHHVLDSVFFLSGQFGHNGLCGSLGLPLICSGCRQNLLFYLIVCINKPKNSWNTLLPGRIPFSILFDALEHIPCPLTICSVTKVLILYVMRGVGRCEGERSPLFWPTLCLPVRYTQTTAGAAHCLAPACFCLNRCSLNSRHIIKVPSQLLQCTYFLTGCVWHIFWIWHCIWNHLDLSMTRL